MLSTIINVSDKHKQDTLHCNCNSNNDGKQMTSIDVRRLEHLLAIEKNYVNIIAHGVQSTITSVAQPTNLIKNKKNN